MPETFLRVLESSDRFGFLNVTGNWDNHRPLLYIACMLSTKNRTVIEYGAGDGSTDLLRALCKATDRAFLSFDNNEEWALKCESIWVEDWDLIPNAMGAGLYFLDHAPGERRQSDLMKLRNKGELFVCHDTEIGGAGAYGWDFSSFPYQLHLNRTGGGAGASLLSDSIRVDEFAGMKFGRFKFDI